MKITFIQTFQNGAQLLGSDMTTVVHNCDTARKLGNAINRHIKRLQLLEDIHPNLKSNYTIKYFSEYK